VVRAGSRGPAPRPLLDRLADIEFEIDENGCWVVPKVADKGYAVMTVGSRADGSRTTAHVHALLYDEVVGDAEPSSVKDHLCRVRACMNPDHVEPVTNVENVMRGEGLFAERARSTTCASGRHEWTEKNTLWERPAGRRPYRRCKSCRRERSGGR
jgi:hypothetical protein